MGVSDCHGLPGLESRKPGCRDSDGGDPYSLPGAIISAVAATSPFAYQAWSQAYSQFVQTGIRWPFPYWIPSLMGDLSNLVILVVLVRRYARSRRDEERLESELEAARTVQKVLIPNEVPTIPGFQIQAVYNPASQVGGDFFQIIGTKSGWRLSSAATWAGMGTPACYDGFAAGGHVSYLPGWILREAGPRFSGPCASAHVCLNPMADSRLVLCYARPTVGLLPRP